MDPSTDRSQGQPQLEQTPDPGVMVPVEPQVTPVSAPIVPETQGMPASGEPQNVPVVDVGHQGSLSGTLVGTGFGAVSGAASGRHSGATKTNYVLVAVAVIPSLIFFSLGMYFFMKTKASVADQQQNSNNSSQSATNQPGQTGGVKTPNQQSATPATAGDSAHDAERKADIDTLQSYLEIVRQQLGGYPSRSIVNNPIARSSSEFKRIDKEVLRDPAGKSYDFASKPTKNMYYYNALPAGCSTNCKSYELGALLDSGEKYSKTN